MDFSTFTDFFKNISSVNEERQKELFEQIQGLNLDEEDTKKLVHGILASHKRAGWLRDFAIVLAMLIPIFFLLNYMGIFDKLKNLSIDQAAKILIDQNTDDKNYSFELKSDTAQVYYHITEEQDTHEKLGKLDISADQAAGLLINSDEDDSRYTIQLESGNPYIAYTMRENAPQRIGKLDPLGNVNIKSYVDFKEKIASYEPTLDKLQQLSFGKINLSLSKTSDLLNETSAVFDVIYPFELSAEEWDFYMKITDIKKIDFNTRQDSSGKKTIRSITKCTYTVQFSEDKENWTNGYSVNYTPNGRFSFKSDPLVVGQKGWRRTYLVVLGMGLPGAYKPGTKESCNNCDYNVANQLNALATAVYIESSK